MNKSKQKVIIIGFVVAIVALVVVGIVVREGGPGTPEGGKEAVMERLQDITVPNKGDTSVDVGGAGYEDVAIPQQQGPAGSASGGRQAETRIFNATIENEKLSPATFIIQREDSVRFRITSGDGKAYDFTISRYAQSRPVAADGSQTEIRFSAYTVGEFSITCEVCGGTQIGTFVVVPKE